MNPYQRSAQKYLFDIIGERYVKNSDIIQRMTNSLVTEADLQNFGKLIVDIYEAGFLRATDEYKENLRKLGYNVDIVKPSQKAP